MPNWIAFFRESFSSSAIFLKLQMKLIFPNSQAKRKQFWPGKNAASSGFPWEKLSLCSCYFSLCKYKARHIQGTVSLGEVL